MTILEEIVAAARARVEREKAAVPEWILPERRPLAFAFEKALRRPGMAFICEVKKASPSKGLIAPDFPYVEIAKDYEEAGATAISVLTEPDYFQGAKRYLAEIREQVDIPLLRKDFIIDPYQIRQAACLGADAVLLICSVLTQKELTSFLEYATALGLSCLVEVHDEEELERALEAGARIIGVNNRDLKTFTIDPMNSIRLRHLVPPDVLFVSESGIHKPEDVRLLEENRVDAVLVGEALMGAPDRKLALRTLKGDR